MQTSESKRQYFHRRLQDLKSKRTPWEDHWRDLAQHIAPHRLRFVTEADRGQKLKSKIVDASATFAWRTLSSGMHSGITSPARPWFRLTTFDPKLKDFQPVKEYLSQVEVRMREIFQASNVYTAFHTGYGDLGLFGQSAMLLVRDKLSVIRMIPLLHGSFWLARDEYGVAHTCYRQVAWTCETIVKRFGIENCSSSVQQAWNNQKYDETFVINHAIEPRHDRDPTKIDRKNKPFASVYWEDQGSLAGDHKLLEESGFDSNPIIAPGWEHVAEDAYCVSPGMDALPDVKALQSMQRMSGEAIEKKVRPPMKAPMSMKNNPASLMPNSITYVDDVSGRGYMPAIEVNLSVTEVEEKIRQTQQRIDRTFYADLFLMLANMDGIQPRNTMEIAERKEEKLLALGPVLENVYSGQLAPTIDRTYEAMNEARILPPPPKELQGQELKVEYISMLAQAQKAISTGSIERLVGFVGNISAGKPEILDKVDLDEAVDQYADMLGAPPSIIVPDDQVKEIRDGRAQAMQQQAQAEQASMVAPALQQGAQAAKVLSETDAGNGQSLLTQLGFN